MVSRSIQHSKSNREK